MGIKRSLHELTALFDALPNCKSKPAHESFLVSW